MSKDNMDPRFAQVLSDPRFRTLKKKERKVKIDRRFEGMFTEKKFKFKSAMDKRGKHMEHESTEDMKSYYELSEEEDGKDEEKHPKPSGSKSKPQKKKVSFVDAEKQEKKKKIPDARGGEESEEELLSSSSDEESSSDEREEFDHQWGELDNDAKREDNIQGTRLAVCNIDWDRIKATDLYVLFNSFKPQGSTVSCVKIYPSEFGKKRMADEEKQGPAELIGNPLPKDENQTDEDEDREEDKEGSSYVREKLRQYQLNRLKYYYAIVECDNEATAAALYGELDGFEYESSASALDVRVVPNDTTFDEEATGECSSMPDPNNYLPPLFITTALQQSKVSLTWDETDPRRKEKFEMAFERSKKGPANDDLSAYLASSGSDESEEDVAETFSKVKAPVDKINKYKDLLKSLDENDGEPEGEIEVTWDGKEEKPDSDEEDETSGSNDKDVGSESSEEELKPTKENPKKKPLTNNLKSTDSTWKNMKGKPSGVFDDVVQDNELGLLLADEVDEKSHFNFENYVKGSKKTKKRTKTVDDNFKFDAEDPRFAAIHTSHLFNVDQSDPHFKRTEAMEKLLEKKQKNPVLQITKITRITPVEEVGKQKPSTDPQLASLINSVKSKTKFFESNKRRKL